MRSGQNRKTATVFGNSGGSSRGSLSLKRGSEIGQGDFQNGSTDYGYVRVKRGEVAFSPEAKVRFHFTDEREDASVHIKDVGIYIRGMIPKQRSKDEN